MGLHKVPQGVPLTRRFPKGTPGVSWGYPGVSQGTPGYPRYLGLRRGHPRAPPPKRGGGGQFSLYPEVRPDPGRRLAQPRRDKCRPPNLWQLGARGYTPLTSIRNVSMRNDPWVPRGTPRYPGDPPGCTEVPRGTLGYTGVPRGVLRGTPGHPGAPGVQRGATSGYWGQQTCDFSGSRWRPETPPDVPGSLCNECWWGQRGLGSILDPFRDQVELGRFRAKLSKVIN
jgi:hypothetical protein